MAVTIGDNSPNSYRIHSITISNQEGNSYEISNLMQSFSITESIYQMFLTGNITILDDMNVYNRIGFTGQEYIRIHISGIQGNEEDPPVDEHIDQIFRIFNVKMQVNTPKNAKLQLYTLEFCSPLLYSARTQRISQAYRGKTGDILNKICKDKLLFTERKKDLTGRVKEGTELGNFFSVFEHSGTEVIGTVIPNWSVFKTLRYLRDKTTDNNKDSRPWGNSYYFYQTASGGFRFHNVGDMLTNKYLNDSVTFRPRFSDGDKTLNYDFADGTGNDILSYNKEDIHNVLHSHLDGTYSGIIQVFDTKSKTLNVIDSQFSQQFPLDGDSKYDYKALSVAPSFRTAPEVIKVPPDGGIEGSELDPAVTFGDATKTKSILETQSAITFDYDNPFNFTNGVHKSGNMAGSDAPQKFDRDRVERLFENNRVNIQISGRTNISCGMTIMVDIKQPTQTAADVRDELTHNGRLLVEGITFVGTQDGLETQLSCTTDGYQDNMDTFVDHEIGVGD